MVPVFLVVYHAHFLIISFELAVNILQVECEVNE